MSRPICELSRSFIALTSTITGILERLSKPILEGFEAGEGTAEGEERLMDVGTALIADGQPTAAPLPGERAFSDPAVATLALARADAIAGDADRDPAPGQRAAAARDVGRLVGVDLCWSLAATPVWLPHRGHGVAQGCEDDRVVPVGTGQERGERDSGAIAHTKVLRAGHPLGLAAISRVGAGEVAPFWPGWWPSQWRPGSRRSGRSSPADPAGRKGADPKRQPPANRATGASTSPRCLTPAPAAPSPTGSPTSARR
jgi:hypothetical protein